MNEIIKQRILDKIKQNQKIIIFRHKRPDGDCVGSTLGLQSIIRETYPEKDVRVINCDYAEYVAFLGKEDDDQPDEFYADALGIVVDTATTDRISNKRYTLCKEVLKIDHHIPVESYAELEWVEEHRCSAAEMIADFYDTFKSELKITSYAATCIYTGIVTDSGRFRFREVSGESLRLAGTMLNVGVDTDTVFAHLYLKDFKVFQFEASLQEQMQTTPNGVIYLYVDKAMQEKYNLTHEEAAATVSLMDSVKGSLIWIAFIDMPNGEIRVRLRSRFVEIDKLANRYHGGGHACASGATVYSAEEMQKLIDDADQWIKDYKENNVGWL